MPLALVEELMTFVVAAVVVVVVVVGKDQPNDALKDWGWKFRETMGVVMLVWRLFLLLVSFVINY